MLSSTQYHSGAAAFRRARIAALAAACLVTLGPLRADATVDGRVSLAKAERAPVMNKRYSMTARGGHLAAVAPRAVVYLEGNFPRTAPPATAEIAQVGVEFVPHILPVLVGTRVEFPNRDTVEHSIYSSSAAKTFNLGRFGPGTQPVPSEVFDTPGVVTVRCDIHENMRAEIIVLGTPYFVVTDEQGHYRLRGLPAGHYVLKAWVSRKLTLEHPVDLADGAVITVNFQ